LIFHRQQRTEEPASCPPFQGEPLSSFFGFLMEKILFFYRASKKSDHALSIITFLFS
jgi:hypothetical protein